MYKLGHVQRKILLSLVGGVALGLSSSPKQYFRTLGEIQKEWKKVNHDSLMRSIKTLSKEKLIDSEKLPDGSFKLTLTKEGRREAGILGLFYNNKCLKKPNKWDKKWRIVIFDIPEKDRVFRKILRDHLKSLDFLKLQNSVFISPYPFEKIILSLVSVYSSKQYVRVIAASYVDNEDKLKKYFFKKNDTT